MSNGDRFMPNADPRAELARATVVARAIFRTMEKTQHSNVYLDLSHLDPVMIHNRFPGINRRVQELRHRHHEGPDSGAARRTICSAA